MAMDHKRNAMTVPKHSVDQCMSCTSLYALDNTYVKAAFGLFMNYPKNFLGEKT